MEYRFALFGMILIVACNGRQEHIPTSTNINDSTFLKTIKWDSLNPYVDYYILSKKDTLLEVEPKFNLKPIATYDYDNRKYTSNLNYTESVFDSGYLRTLVLSDTFSHFGKLDCFLKINSGITFKLQPSVLGTLYVTPIDQSKSGINSVISELTNEKYAVEVLADSVRPFDRPVHRYGVSKIPNDDTVYLKILLKDNFLNLDSINTICRRLNERSDIYPIEFTKMFVGQVEFETIYRLKSL